jgi:hypothetical protein
MIERLAPLLGRVDRDLQALLDLLLADELVLSRRPKRGLGRGLFR